MNEKILESIKELLNLTPDNGDSFDKKILLHINSVFMILNQIGIGQEEPFIVKKDSIWKDFLDNDKSIESVKEYIALKVQLIFDPPQAGSAVNAINERIKELETRLYYRKNFNNN